MSRWRARFASTRGRSSAGVWPESSRAPTRPGARGAFRARRSAPPGSTAPFAQTASSASSGRRRSPAVSFEPISRAPRSEGVRCATDGRGPAQSSVTSSGRSRISCGSRAESRAFAFSSDAGTARDLLARVGTSSRPWRRDSPREEAVTRARLRVGTLRKLRKLTRRTIAIGSQPRDVPKGKSRKRAVSRRGEIWSPKPVTPGPSSWAPRWPVT